MSTVIDLHSHSPFAGGAGKVDLSRLLFVMEAKGIDVYGTGDILLKKWRDILFSNLRFDEKTGLLELSPNRRLMLQTEIVVTLPYVSNPKRRKSFHVVLLFPSKESLKNTETLLLKKGTKLSIGRPFLKLSSSEELIETFSILREYGTGIILAHVMTRSGIFGGVNPISSLKDIDERLPSLVDALETGLSADPLMLQHVETSLPLVSFSDSHSSQFSKLGREFTLIDAIPDAKEIIEAIKKGKIIKTFEFPPQEGKYHLTGHRGDRPGHHGKEYYTFSDETSCPICKKPMIKGVFQRCKEISGNESRLQRFSYQVPLIEVVALTMGMGTGSKRVTETYLDAVKACGGETAIWITDEKDAERCLSGISEKLARAVTLIKRGEFEFSPPGFDGRYGTLKIPF